MTSPTPTPTPTPSPTPSTEPDLARLLADWRPRLHRYCVRMTGSLLDGEDVVQDTLLKASLAFDPDDIRHPERWLFRIAHNAAMDLLRRRAREQAAIVEQPYDELAHEVPDEDRALDRRETAHQALHRFMQLPPAQRAAVILADVLEHSLDEAAALQSVTVPAFKAALHRGRKRLRELGADDAAPPPLSPGDRQLLDLYVQRFNARDFDALRALLADEVRLDLVGRRDDRGREVVGVYFGNYARLAGWRVRAGNIEGRPALQVTEASDPGADAAPQPYWVVLDFVGDRVSLIRDFRYARYAMEAIGTGNCRAHDIAHT